jgi:hypothetical protein
VNFNGSADDIVRQFRSRAKQVVHDKPFTDGANKVDGENQGGNKPSSVVSVLSCSINPSAFQQFRLRSLKFGLSPTINS